MSPVGWLIVAVSALTYAGRDHESRPQARYAGRTDLVRVEVGVLDKTGRPLMGLTPTDFTVLVKGKPQEIATFGSTEAPAITTGGRQVALVFDAWIRREDQTKARRIARRVVERLGPDDLVVVVHPLDLAAGTSRDSELTADREQLFAAIDQPLSADSGTRENCACGSCVAAAAVRLIDAFRHRTDRQKLVYFVGTYFTMGESDGRAGCDGAMAEARERIAQAAEAAAVEMDAIDPRDLDRTGLPWVFIRNQYVLGFVPGANRITNARDLQIKVNRPEAGGVRWVFRTQK
jgi:VWFA-related protein